MSINKQSPLTTKYGFAIATMRSMFYLRNAQVMREKLQEALLIIGEIPSDPVDEIRIKQPKKNV
jgi:hypothetical protein|tara:strand:- start:2841 stop:3032 length:192 start_codon:yes stop_codon:yes gene_type:complete